LRHARACRGHPRLYGPCTSVDVDRRDKPGHDGDGNEELFLPSPSPVRRVERDVLGDLTLPALAIREQTLLVVVELLARFSREFKIRAFDNGVNRTGFLAKPAINAFHHVDVVTRRSACAIIAARPGLNRDSLCRTDCLAELACDAALFPVGIATQGMFTAEARRNWPFLEWIVQRCLRLEEVAHGQHEAGHELHQKHTPGRAVEPHWILISPCPLTTNRIG